MYATKAFKLVIALFFTLCLSIFNQHLYTHADIIYVDSNDATVNTYEVVQLTNNNFDTYIKSSSNVNEVNDRNRWLVMFTSPDCGYCAKLKTEVSYTMSKLEAKKSTLRIGNVDATVEKELKERFKVEGYPTIYYFENGEPLQQFTLQRTEAAILKFDARTSPSNPVHVAESLKDIEQYCYASNDARVLSEEPVTFVLVTSNKNDDSSGVNDAASFAFQNIAKKRRSFYFFAQVSESAEIKEKFIRDAFNNLKPPYIIRIERGYKNRYFPSTNSIENHHTSIVNETDINAWIKLNNPPTLAKLSALNYYQITHAGRKLAMMIMTSGDSSMQVRNRIAMERFEECARKYSGPDNLYFGTLTDTDNSMAPFIAQFVVDFTALPRVIVIDAENGFFYEDQEIETNQGKCAVILAALEGKIPYQREGLMGYPWRGYKVFVRFYPYSLMVAVGFFFLVGFFYYVCVISTGGDDDEDDIGPNPITNQDGSNENKISTEGSKKQGSISKGKKDRNKKHKD